MKDIEKQLIITRLEHIKENGEEAFKNTGDSYAAKSGALIGSIDALIRDIENGDYDLER